ncbi:MAG: exonuclease, partial [Gammaproteobacteria bacterium]
MSNIIVDIEADGPVPGLYSMVSFGAVILSEDLDKTFYGQCRPLPDADWIATSLEVSGHSREEVLTFPDPADTMREFAEWIEANTKGRPIFWADNNGFDFAF